MPENRSKMNTYGLPQHAFVHGNRIRMVQAPNIYVTALYLMCEVPHYCKIHSKRHALSNKKKMHVHRHLLKQSFHSGISTNTLCTPATSKYESKIDDVQGRVWDAKVRMRKSYPMRAC
jgi:hypothetical protein